ncbi:Ethylene-responsive transcription factor CRF1 [Hordeum vulgare]|nr:Ethylene-responsive transcription factor CRF1 [Hordeum vulgare]
MRLGLATFDTAKEAAPVFDAAAWPMNRPRREMNFPEVMTMELAQNLAPHPWVVTDEDCRRSRRRECCLSIAEMDEHAMEAWCRQFPHDILDEHQFFAQRRAERAEQAAYHADRRTQKKVALFEMELKEASTWSSNDERWCDTFITTEE